MSDPGSILRRLKRRWYLLLLAKYAAVTGMVGIGCFVATSSWTYALLLIIAAVALTLYADRARLPSDRDIIGLINAQHPVLEYSTALTTLPATGLAAVQRQKVQRLLATRKIGLRYPINWRPLGWAAVLGMTCVLGRHLFIEEAFRAHHSNAPIESMSAMVSQQDSAIAIREIRSTISPPNYTKRSTISTMNPALKILEGSRWHVDVTFSRQPDFARLLLSSNEAHDLTIEGTKGTLLLSNLTEGFYVIQFLSGEDTLQSPYYPIEVIEDRPPAIEVVGVESYERVRYHPDAGVSLNARISDDYGLVEAFVTATITKGSGESVKFREERLDFEQKVAGRLAQTQMQLRVSDFDMEPGNELYFFVTARDNRQPTAQATRTETFFFVLEDTTSIEFSIQGNLGVDLMPEYFRSQRQIIIDTEKLLAERGRLSEEAFNQGSNELGFDQKALRLRYGQFLGEEDESGIAVEAGPEEEESVPGEDVLEEFGHDHDHEEEEGQLLDKGTYDEEAEDIVEELSHSHDDAETATFYTISMKTKLKAALNEMWDAELHLRLFDPQKSLPYQYAALKLLKEIKNHARIYVQRIGFEPPAIPVQEKRLTGDLSEVKDQTFEQSTEDSIQFPAIEDAAQAIARLMPIKRDIPNDLSEYLRQAGNELAGVALEEPGKYLETLSEISKLMNKEILHVEDEGSLTSIQHVLLTLLQRRTPVIAPSPTTNHPLMEAFKEELVRDQTYPE